MGQDRKQNLKPTNIIPTPRLIDLELAYFTIKPGSPWSKIPIKNINCYFDWAKNNAPEARKEIA